MAGQCRQKAEVIVHTYLKADQPSSKDFIGFKKPPCESLRVPSAPDIQFKHYPTLFLLPVLYLSLPVFHLQTYRNQTLM